MAADPMLGADVGPVDCLVTLLMLDSACRDSQEYQEAVKRLADLIKPGGLIVNTGQLFSIQCFLCQQFCKNTLLTFYILNV